MSSKSAGASLSGNHIDQAPNPGGMFPHPYLMSKHSSDGAITISKVDPPFAMEPNSDTSIMRS